MRLGPVIALALLLSGCTGGSDEATGRGSVAGALGEPEAARVIRTVEEFGDPIYLEVWESESPTARRLAARGYVELDGRRLVLTDQAVRLGATEDFFQDDIPVFQFPVGRRELTRITAIREVPNAASSKRVEFRYRRAPTELGRQLIEDGSRLDELGAERELPGLAFITPSADGWTVAALEL